MKKIKIISIFNLLLISLISFVSCGEKDKPSSQDSHICSYSTAWSKNETKHWKECSCGKKVEEVNHSFGQWKEIEKATTLKQGLQEKTCTICDYKLQEEIPMVSPVYSWRSIDLLQPTVIISEKSEMVLDKDGIKKPFVDLVDRQLDMLAQEIISRIEYVYGNNNQKETHYIKDNIDNSTFTSYESMNAFSESLSTSYSAYDYNDEYVGTGYIMYVDGVATLYDSTIHSHYVLVNGEKYAAICKMNVAGNFTSETAFQYTIHKVTGTPTISHSDDSIYFDKILTLQGAIYGTPTWEYEKKSVGNYTYYNFKYETNSSSQSWNWSNEFLKGTAKDKLKNYLAYIVANNITNYNNLPNENVIISSNYDQLLNKINYIGSYVSEYKDTIQKVLTNRMIGNAYQGDTSAGEMGNTIANAIYKTSESVRTSISDNYYIDGHYKQLYVYGTEFSYSELKEINNYAGTNLIVDDFITACNYKGYDVILNGILRQVTSQSIYQDCAPMQYEIKSSNSSINTTANETDVYLFFKANSQDDIRFILGVPYDTNVTLKDKNGNVIVFTKENIDNQLVLILKDNTLPSISDVPNDLSNIQGYGASSSLDELLEDLDYLELTIEGVNSFTLNIEEYAQVD